VRRPTGKKGQYEWVRPRTAESQALSRVLAEDVLVPDGKGEKVLVEAGTEIDDEVIDLLVENGVGEVQCRSVLTCESRLGVCQLCYGRSLATNRLVDIGEAVGIIAAQSIGEPGTQLTMRTFHTGGIAGEDITHGLPRVVELFEARTPKGMTPIAEFSGHVTIEDVEKGVQLTVTSVKVRSGAPSSVAASACGSTTTRRSRSASRWSRGPRTPRSCCACSASGPRRSTWSTRCRRSTPRRV